MEDNKIFISKNEESESKNEIINDTTEKLEINSEMQIIEDSKSKSKKSIETENSEQESKQEKEENSIKKLIIHFK